MKLFILLAGISSCLAAPHGLPSFKISGYSRSNLPEMEVTFEKGQAHEMVLEPYSNSPCNFVGELKNNHGAVAVTGCLHKTGDKMHITVLSDLNTKSSIYELDYDGHVTALENPLKYQKERSGKFPLKNREAGSNKCTIENEFEKDDDEMGDEEIDLSFELGAEIQAANVLTWPSERYAYVKFGYDRTLKNKLASENTNFATWIDSVMTHVQAHYRHQSLPTKIQFKYDVSESIYKDQDMPSTDYLNAWSDIGKDDADPKVDLYAAFGYDPPQPGMSTVGLAWVGGACNDRIKTSMNEHRGSPAETAMVAAHEIGHNFGMSHDFDAKHGGDNGYCNGKGIMSYGDAPSAWSSCSVSDFTKYYNSQNWGETCLKDWGPYCGDACPGGGCRANPDSVCSSIASFGGCNGRYASILQPACQKSCGICSDGGNGGGTAPAPVCTDTANGAADNYGDSCDAYAKNKSWCGNYNNAVFESDKMCCGCGGGSTAAAGK